MSQRPDVAEIPLMSLLQTFKDGANQEGLLQSRLPDIQCIMSPIRNSRECWFAERMGMEAIGRDCGDANIVLTLNMDPRAWPDVRNLIYKLENGFESMMPLDYYVRKTQEFTDLLDKCIFVYMRGKLRCTCTGKLNFS